MKKHENIIEKNMKSIAGAGEKVMQTMNDNMACFNLPLHMIEHSHYVWELNKTLVNLVEFLANEIRDSHRKLNLAAAACAPSTINTTKETSAEEVAEANNNKGDDV